MKKFLLWAALLPLFAHATILNVPGTYTTIQSAINVAQDYDTVLVEPGTYYENLHFRGRDILLTSRYYISGDTSYIRSTIIDGSQPVSPDTGSCIILNYGETSDCVIQGFTITGGTGTVWVDEHGAGTYREGGGILVEVSSPTIQFNIIRDNVATNVTNITSAGGGAIRCGDADPQIRNNVICGNKGRYGAGIVMNYCTGIIANNLIVYNEGGQAFGGAGIWCNGTDTNTVVKIFNNTIAHNHALGGGTYGGKGGGIFVFAVRLLVTNNIVWDNTQTGGGPIARFLNAVVHANYSDIQGGYVGNGNLNVNPAFDDTLCFHLLASSPCIDAGDSTLDDLTITGNTPEPPALGQLRSDMGCYGGPDEHVLPCCTPVAPSSIVEHHQLQFAEIFPVPASDVLHILLKDNCDYDMQIVDVSGQLVYSEKLNASSQINVSHWARGMYFVRLRGENGITQEEKLVVMR